MLGIYVRASPLEVMAVKIIYIYSLHLSNTGMNGECYNNISEQVT